MKEEREGQTDWSKERKVGNREKGGGEVLKRAPRGCGVPAGCLWA